MISIRWLLNNEEENSSTFRSALQTALDEREIDPRLNGNIRERADAEADLNTVRVIAHRYGIKATVVKAAQPHLSNDERKLLDWLTAAIMEKAAREERQVQAGPEMRPEFVTGGAQLLINVEGIGMDVLANLEFT